MALSGVIWGLFALCAISLCGRLSIRIVCFRKLFAEDYLMVAVLGVMLANAILCQTQLDLLYVIEAIGNQGKEARPPPTFAEDVTQATHAALAGGLVCMVGIWAVKYNFLLFFYRLGSRLRPYRIFWWVVVATTTACFAVLLGLYDYQCTSTSVDKIRGTCATKENVDMDSGYTILNCTVDIFTDVISKSMPISVLVPLDRD
ncbi:uncharacterized protein PG998_014898 [Apiospora kogelbergensis]|uniref:uncharacterized protein n=1 Tax=Apiospora kogelbergensis TaxID=1337665 RepID=UPI003130B47F